jgi:predicted alpha/beta-hydrolase family hydrolase
MGGRIASMLVAEDEALADGLLVLGYPFHPPGKPEKLRTDHFPEIKTPSLILQGERDTFGGREFAETLQLPANMKLHWVPDGDHSFKPRKASGRTELENWEDAATAIAAFPW